MREIDLFAPEFLRPKTEEDYQQQDFINNMMNELKLLINDDFEFTLYDNWEDGKLTMFQLYLEGEIDRVVDSLIIMGFEPV